MVKMKKVLVLSSSPRKGGNSDILCDEFILGAKESGNDYACLSESERPCQHVVPALIPSVTHKLDPPMVDGDRRTRIL